MMGMSTISSFRRAGAGLLVTVGLAALVAGCGSSGSSKASPIPGSGSSATTVVTGSPGTATHASPTTQAGAKHVEPSSADLAALDHDLQSARSDLDATSSAINNADVDTAKTQEGSAP
jgi:hypothetical protein